MAGEKCTVVMYHYVRNAHETAFPGIKAISVEGFRAQLRHIVRNYSVIPLGQYADFLNGNGNIPRNSAVLSFDDGFRDHYENAFPILREFGISGCFFPIGLPLASGIVPAVQKAHFLLAKIGAEKLAGEFNAGLGKEFPEIAEKFFVDGNVKKERKYRFDDTLTANLKYSIATMPEKQKMRILGGIFSRHFEGEKEFCRQLYMNLDEMREMLAAGMEIGAHTMSHPCLALLGESEQAKEIKESKALLEGKLHSGVSLFSYPYGNFNETTIGLLCRNGYSCGLTTKPKVNEGTIDAFRIGRLDTNDLPQK